MFLFSSKFSNQVMVVIRILKVNIFVGSVAVVVFEVFFILKYIKIIFFKKIIFDISTSK
jgi:hypothetical protein